MKLIIIAIIIALASADYNPDTSAWKTADLGGEMSHTLQNVGQQPVTAQAATSAGWTKSGNCVPNLGVLYTPPGGESADSPLAAYYTPYGQLTGLKMKFYDQTHKGMVFEKGYIQNDELSVTFRSGNDVCSNSALPLAIGDRLVVNQHTIAKRIPMFANEADSANFQAGSCMAKMGQHWMYDLEKAPQMSWEPEKLLPVVPMYYTTGPKTGQLQAFFFTTWVCQNGSGKNWDNVPIICGLTNSMMCKNWCNEQCGWKNDGDRFGTYHVFFNNDPSSVKCAHPKSFWDNPVDYAMGRECPANTPSPKN